MKRGNGDQLEPLTSTFEFDIPARLGQVMLDGGDSSFITEEPWMNMNPKLPTAATVFASCLFYMLKLLLHPSQERETEQR